MILAAIFLAAATAASDGATAVTDSEIWNRGVECYRAGDVTNALETLRPLTSSRSHGPRAAEVVAKLCLESSDPTKRDEAAEMAQIALRANPKDERAQRNFTRAVDGLAVERENNRINAILKAFKGKDPSGAVKGGMYTVRRLMTESLGYRTNVAERIVALSDRYYLETKAAADIWIPVKAAIAQSVTNEEQAATISAEVDEARKRTLAAAQTFADLADNSYTPLAASEQDFDQFLKLVAPPPLALGEDRQAQTNAYLDVEAINDRPWQNEALEFTRAFRAKFPMYAKDYEQRAQSDTNLPPFTAEDQAKISALATELEKAQLECCEKQLPPRQLEALRLIDEIQKLMPPEKGGGGQQGQPQGQPQNNQDQSKDKNQQQDQNQQDQGQQQDQNQEQQDQQPPEDQKENEQESEAEEDKESPEDKDVEALLKKAQERNDEHEADKKARMRRAKLPPNERDW